MCGSGFVVDHHGLGGVLGQGAAFRDHGHDPFAGIAHDAVGERIALDLGRVDAGQDGVGVGLELLAGEHVVHARHGQGSGGVDRDDPGVGVGAGDDGHVQHAGQLDVGGVAALADDEVAVTARRWRPM